MPGRLLGVLHPLLYIYTKVAPKLIETIANKVGIPGLIGLPFLSIATERCTYDTFCAARGIDLYSEQMARGANLHGSYPSGGAALPSLALISVASERERFIVEFLGDLPRQESTADGKSANTRENRAAFAEGKEISFGDCAAKLSESS
eukprot:TRINITY_DN27553_c0_g1_i1.p1 TRINITY_DN27553_c0_g1~~TRINITY_DN27553_c0_g1_i1.p1  ORF type:complete len:148 (+),score=33.47 TRINITY_DN27553_c0_g1_i1:97-540(+)